MGQLRCWMVAVLSTAMLACSSSGGGRGSNGAVTPGQPSGVTAGTGGSGTSNGTGGMNFGNPGMQPTVSGPPLTPMDAGTPVADGSTCQVGQFCASNNPDQGCGTLTLASTVKMVMNPGNVLIIWDRSTSMLQDWSGMVKWQAAGNALIAALTPLQDQLTIGALLFPAYPDGMCAIHQITDVDQVDFQPGPAALAALQAAGPMGVPNPLYAADMSVLAETPTAEAISAANQAVLTATLTGTTAIILVTDGEPNCNWDQAASTQILSNLDQTYAIKTYVVGLPGSMGGNGPSVLTALAQAGGTMQYLTPTDQMQLQQKIHDIVVSTVMAGFDSCSIDLMPPTSTPDKLQLVVEETANPGIPESVPHDLGSSGGWTISADGSHVELVGGLCTSAMGGTFSKLTFEFGCKDIPPLPPSHVM